jgi:hypothetical protein
VSAFCSSANVVHGLDLGELKRGREEALSERVRTQG